MGNHSLYFTIKILVLQLAKLAVVLPESLDQLRDRPIKKIPHITVRNFFI